MAKKKEIEKEIEKEDDFAISLIKQLNKEKGEKIAFNLSSDDAPTNIKRWISTGSQQLDFIIANSLGGGLPEGRVIELQGPTSSGKSHIAFEAAKDTQRKGGIVVYVDTENATSLNNLQQLGIDVKRKFVFCQTACTEEIFSIIESTILKARAMVKDVPVTIIWDSVAASSPKAELEGDYDQNTIGLQARVLGKGMRKIVNIIGNQNVTLLLINQQRQKIGVMFGDPTTTPGGMAIPYASSVRIRIQSTGQTQIKDKKGNVLGIKVTAKTIKNRVARPFRQCDFSIIFGVGVVEHEEVFDLFRAHCEEKNGGKGVELDDSYISINGGGAWKYFTVTNAKTGEVTIEEKFYKNDFNTVLYNQNYKKYMDALFESALKMDPNDMKHPTFTGVNNESIEEAEALQNEE